MPTAGGRRLSPRSAWAVLAVLDRVGEGDWSGLRLSRTERARAEERAAAQPCAMPGALASRAQVSHWRVHPSVLGEVINDNAVVPLPLEVGGVLRTAHWVYARSVDLRALEHRWPLASVSPIEANLVVRSAQAVWPFRGRQVPAVIAAVDLLDSGDARSVLEASRMLSKIALGR